MSTSRNNVDSSNSRNNILQAVKWLYNTYIITTTERVHVGIWFVLIGLKYILSTYMDPLRHIHGSEHRVEAFGVTGWERLRM